MLFKNIFHKKSLKLIPFSEASIELISLHIPKTAGTSFRELLNLNYGKHEVAQFDIVYENGKKEYLLFGNKISEPLVPAKTRIIHGHFEYFRLIETHPPLKKIPVVTWLRDPAQRVISNYRYLNAIFVDLIKQNNLSISLYPRLQNSLIEFASREQEQNRMSKFCKGIDTDKALFIGKVERYNEDLQKLAELLNWKVNQSVKSNVTNSKKFEYNDDTIKRIMEFNIQDVELYNSIK